MPLNVELLRKVKRHILAEPKRLVMSEGLVYGTAGETYSPSAAYNEPDDLPFPKCGTVGCIAGWTCVVGEKGFRGGGIPVGSG